MPLQSVSIDRFRNLESVQLTLSPELNLFSGANAAGKTSLLEALYVLGRGRSFRTGSLDNAIRTGADRFEIVAQLSVDSGRVIPVGLRRSGKMLEARVNGEPVGRLSDLAVLFPIQWLGGNLHSLLEEGPSRRRQFLDWGMFHVKHAYMPLWKRFQKLLKQRNAALRNRASPREIHAWDSDLIDVSEALHNFREDYVAALNPVLRDVMQNLMTENGEFSIHYRKGWTAESSYAEYLNTQLETDRERGFTRAGPHRAELGFKFDGEPVSERLSRGQQKLFVTGLKVAQARLLRQMTETSSLFLIDDIGSELDERNQVRVMNTLAGLGAQVFVTSIQEPRSDDWNMPNIKRFHVEHGVVTEVL